MPPSASRAPRNSLEAFFCRFEMAEVPGDHRTVGPLDALCLIATVLIDAMRRFECSRRKLSERLFTGLPSTSAPALRIRKQSDGTPEPSTDRGVALVLT